MAVPQAGPSSSSATAYLPPTQPESKARFTHQAPDRDSQHSDTHSCSGPGDEDRAMCLPSVEGELDCAQSHPTANTRAKKGSPPACQPQSLQRQDWGKNCLKVCRCVKPCQSEINCQFDTRHFPTQTLPDPTWHVQPPTSEISQPAKSPVQMASCVQDPNSAD